MCASLYLELGCFQVESRGAQVSEYTRTCVRMDGCSCDSDATLDFHSQLDAINTCKIIVSIGYTRDSLTPRTASSILYLGLVYLLQPRWVQSTRRSRFIFIETYYIFYIIIHSEVRDKERVLARVFLETSSLRGQSSRCGWSWDWKLKTRDVHFLLLQNAWRRPIDPRFRRADFPCEWHPASRTQISINKFHATGIVRLHVMITASVTASGCI